MMQSTFSLLGPDFMVNIVTAKEKAACKSQPVAITGK